VVVGEGREPITGVLPLFINPTHWSVARQLAKPVFGWMCTLNPLVRERHMRSILRCATLGFADAMCEHMQQATTLMCCLAKQQAAVPATLTLVPTRWPVSRTMRAAEASAYPPLASPLPLSPKRPLISCPLSSPLPTTPH
jgi:hypothetical protein